MYRRPASGIRHPSRPDRRPGKNRQPIEPRRATPDHGQQPHQSPLPHRLFHQGTHPPDPRGPRRAALRLHWRNPPRSAEYSAGDRRHAGPCPTAGEAQADLAVAEAVRLVKSNSSGWINENQKIRGRFEWQTGYFAVSVSESRVDEVRRYIRTQKEHHARISFQDELVRLLKKHRITFDEKYLLG